MAKGNLTKAELSLRVQEVQNLLLNGATLSKIVEHGKKWNVSNRTIDDYIRKAKEKIAEINNPIVEETRSIILTDLWDLYQTAETKEKHKLLMSIAKIAGLDKITLHHNINNVRELHGLSNEELHAIINEGDKPDE